MRGDVRTSTTASDAELVFATRGGNPQAAEVLYRRTVHLVHGLAFRLTGRYGDHQEIVRETFGQIFSQLTDLAHPETLRPWIAGVVVKAVHRTIWKRRLLARFGLAKVPATSFDAALAQEAAEPSSAELQALYARAERLPLRLRTVLLLHRVEGMKLGDIAIAMEAPVSSVRRWVRRAEARAGIVGPAAGSA